VEDAAFWAEGANAAAPARREAKIATFMVIWMYDQILNENYGEIQRGLPFALRAPRVSRGIPSTYKRPTSSRKRKKHSQGYTSTGFRSCRMPWGRSYRIGTHGSSLRQIDYRYGLQTVARAWEATGSSEVFTTHSSPPVEPMLVVQFFPNSEAVYWVKTILKMKLNNRSSREKILLYVKKSHDHF
jgi:hypothetical protein